jgi:hypothetical protein
MGMNLEVSIGYTVLRNKLHIQSNWETEKPDCKQGRMIDYVSHGRGMNARAHALSNLDLLVSVDHFCKKCFKKELAA